MPGALVRHMLLPHRGDLDVSVSVLAYFLDNLMTSLAASKAAKPEEKKNTKNQSLGWYLFPQIMQRPQPDKFWYAS